MIPISSWATPLSENVSVALIDDHTACVIVSYEFQVHCLDRAGELVGVFGREGDGPGEFTFAYALFRRPERTVGVLDPLASRFSVFRPTGELVAEMAVPRMFAPLSPIGETMIGTYEPDFLSHRKILAELDLSGGAVLWRREFRMPSDIGLPAKCSLSQRGAVSPGSVLAFGVCHSHLLFYPAGGEGEVVAVEAPTYAGELPNQRDIDEYREDTRFLYRDGVVPDAAVQAFAATPIVDFIAGQAMTYDANRVLWVGAMRDRDRSSSLDLYLDGASLRAVGRG